MLRRRLALVLAFVLALVSVLLVAPRDARADQPGGHTVQIAVLGFDSEEADDQADALTGALRSRVRGASGWSLMETSASLGMLTAGLKCPPRPTPDCQQRIADQLKTERYIWGIVTKGPTAGHVTAEVHLFQKGKPDTTFKEQFSDNLKDPNDEKGIGKIAARIVERLAGSVLGTIVVKAGDASGEVVLDGDKRVALVSGSAKLEASPGSHSIEITSGAGAPTKRTVLVTAGKESVVELGAAEPAGPQEPGKPFPTRKAIGGGVLAAGVVLGVLSVVNLTSWMDDKSKGEDLAKFVPNGEKPCDPNGNAEFCQLDKDAKTHSAVAIVTGSLGAVALGVGAYLFFVDGGGSSDKAAAAAAARKTRVLPTVGQTNGLVLSGSF